MSIDDGSPPDLLDDLSGRVAEARAQWPQIRADAADFSAYLLERIRRSPHPTLERWHVGDLYLVWAALAHDPFAVAMVDKWVAEACRKAGAQFRKSDHEIADITQNVRERMFVGRQSPPRLTEYDGTGALAAWLRICSTRTFLDARKATVREHPESASFMAAIEGGEPSAELQYLYRSYEDLVHAAFTRASAQLDAREKTLLRHIYSDGRTLDEIARAYGVHESTASRWLKRARISLIQAVRTALVEELKVSESKVGDALHDVLSRLDVSMTTLLRSDEDPPASVSPESPKV